MLATTGAVAVINPFLGLILSLIILGVIFYFVMSIPMAEPFPTLIRLVLVIAAIYFLIHFL